MGGPAFSFGVRASSSWAGASSLFAGPGKDSPGPAAYYDPYPANASDAIRGHVPGTAFGKPPEKREAERRSGGGAYVWGSGAFPAPDPSAPGPGHYEPRKPGEDMNKRSFNATVDGAPNAFRGEL